LLHRYGPTIAKFVNGALQPLIITVILYQRALASAIGVDFGGFWRRNLQVLPSLVA
jgi:hypothetical protein